MPMHYFRSSQIKNDKAGEIVNKFARQFPTALKPIRINEAAITTFDQAVRYAMLSGTALGLLLAPSFGLKSGIVFGFVSGISILYYLYKTHTQEGRFSTVHEFIAYQNASIAQQHACSRESRDQKLLTEIHSNLTTAQALLKQCADSEMVKPTNALIAQGLQKLSQKNN